MESALKLPESKLDFDEDQHLYSLGGIRLPSVTQVMRPLSMMLYEGVSSMTMHEAASRGTRAHEQISNMIVYGIEESDEDTSPYLDAFKSFENMHDDYKPEWIESEYMTYHKNLRYAGTIDLIGYVTPDDGTGVDVIDLKTTAVWHGVSLRTQVAAYSEALRSQGIAVRSAYGLQLKKDRTFRFEKLDIKDGYRTFLMCLGLYNALAEELG